MTPLKFDVSGGYVVCDRDEWIADRTAGENVEATAAFEAWCESHDDERSISAQLVAWLRSIDASGIYNEGDAVQVCTVNEENFLDSEMVLTFANTELYGTLFIWQEESYWTKSRTSSRTSSWSSRRVSKDAHILTFNGYDDADAFGWSSGSAKCSENVNAGGKCGAEWIVDSACTLWHNGGGPNGPHRIGDLALTGDDDCDMCEDRKPICPMCNVGTLTFYAS